MVSLEKEHKDSILANLGNVPVKKVPLQMGDVPEIGKEFSQSGMRFY